MNSFKIQFLILLTILSCITSEISAATIPGIYSTGLNDNFNLLADGETDSHYSLIESSDKHFSGPKTKVVNSNVYPMNVWFPNNNTSKWIAPRADAGLANEHGVYVYRITFDLSKFKSKTAVVYGLWTSDDKGIDILINGQKSGNFTPLASFYAMFSFVINSGFSDGINTIDFVIHNVVSSSGLRVEIKGEADLKEYVVR